mmetsp:Transcript_85783/g.199387  ORF Transcript_85783/g.199387 Transcript_85783/m.199387 type:complete len:253 (+) Transcript_85783:252-1010(+)
MELNPESCAWVSNDAPTRLLWIACYWLWTSNGYHFPGTTWLCRIVHHVWVLITNNVKELLAHHTHSDLSTVQRRDLGMLLQGVHAPRVERARKIEALPPLERLSAHDFAPDGLPPFKHLHLVELADGVLIYWHTIGLPFLRIVSEHQDVWWSGGSNPISHCFPEVSLAKSATCDCVFSISHGMCVGTSEAKRADARICTVVLTRKRLCDELCREALGVQVRIALPQVQIGRCLCPHHLQAALDEACHACATF